MSSKLLISPTTTLVHLKLYFIYRPPNDNDLAISIALKIKCKINMAFEALELHLFLFSITPVFFQLYKQPQNMISSKLWLIANPCPSFNTIHHSGLELNFNALVSISRPLQISKLGPSIT